jgi:hypothetical protein
MNIQILPVIKPSDLYIQLLETASELNQTKYVARTLLHTDI